MNFHDAVLHRVVWDELRVLHIELREVPTVGSVTLRIVGCSEFFSSGELEPDWFLSDVVFIGREGVITPPWTGPRQVWRTIVLGTNGAYFEVVYGTVELILP
ncbi:MAG: hypothetical protein MUC96_01980 [Myxococcaceae bacterium]|jgi:hypothetical protein|nr:hypothetical protein [Myxococcaceae bacterium]